MTQNAPNDDRRNALPEVEPSEIELGKKVTEAVEARKIADEVVGDVLKELDRAQDVLRDCRRSTRLAKARLMDKLGDPTDLKDLDDPSEPTDRR